MRSEVEQMIRAATAMQVAAYEYENDNSGTQFEARQAINGLREALNSANYAMGLMQRQVERTRQLARKADA